MARPEDLIQRLEAADCGWPVYSQLVGHVRSVVWRIESDPYLGSFFVSDQSFISFAHRSAEMVWPSWLPGYVPALAGMKAGDPEIAGGHADQFSGRTTEEGSVFAPGGMDDQLGYPLIAVPDGVYEFQVNSAGKRDTTAGHHIVKANKHLIFSICEPMFAPSIQPVGCLCLGFHV